MSTTTQPIYIVSVNNTPDVAKKLVAQLIEVLQNLKNAPYIFQTDFVRNCNHNTIWYMLRTPKVYTL